MEHCNKPGQAHEAVFHFAQPVDFSGPVAVRMLFERYYASGLGRFRISITTAPKGAQARNHGAQVEDILAMPAGQRLPKERQILAPRFLESAPELAKERKDIDKLKTSLPVYPTPMVVK